MALDDLSINDGNCPPSSKFNKSQYAIISYCTTEDREGHHSLHNLILVIKLVPICPPHKDDMLVLMLGNFIASTRI